MQKRPINGSLIEFFLKNRKENFKLKNLIYSKIFLSKNLISTLSNTNFFMYLEHGIYSKFYWGCLNLNLFSLGLTSHPSRYLTLVLISQNKKFVLRLNCWNICGSFKIVLYKIYNFLQKEWSAKVFPNWRWKFSI